MTRFFFVLTAGLIFLAASWAQTNACDLNQDTGVNVVDVQLSIAMHLGFRTCTANVAGSGVCNPDVVERVKAAALGGVCFTRTVRLSWTASTSTGVVGYNIYRRLASGGNYAKVNSSPIAGTSYVDTGVQPSQSYQYVARAVNSSGQESADSNVAQATTPSS